ncbi:MAG: Probable nicotinate-nucleotide adenylyltransferase [uncultured Sulfurovum sp.]|uniref:Probable nicotinate-nucleotide adenylyltransferase n=1 Tax=uncultured Sulfurovum sp. TaxID=269237 RepID=A0A6S6TXC9_9BACT|nr:MAG: Probable nicotinate-nucleotide adenylyltransferase [uncultured Sulfurovum sp.]
MFKKNRESVALFGGSFDPPHLGHKTVIEEALKALEIDKLIVIPTFLNPFKTLSHFTVLERFSLSKELFNVFEKVIISDYEINQKKPTPTVETLKYFMKKYEVLYLIVGADNLENIEKWKAFEYLNAQIIWVVATRSGYEIKSDKLRDFKVLNISVDISSTQIRNTMTKENS